MTRRMPVAEADELDSGDRKIVSREGGVEIGVFNVGGEYHALLNVCAHQHGPVCRGSVLKEVEGEFVETGTRVEERYGERTIVKCPWHGWEFDIETGEHIGDGRWSVPTFDTVVEDGVVYVVP